MFEANVLSLPLNPLSPREPLQPLLWHGILDITLHPLILLRQRDFRAREPFIRFQPLHASKRPCHIQAPQSSALSLRRSQAPQFKCQLQTAVAILMQSSP